MVASTVERRRRSLLAQVRVDDRLNLIGPDLIAFRREMKEIRHDLPAQGAVRLQKLFAKIDEDDFLAVAQLGKGLVYPLILVRTSSAGRAPRGKMP